MPAVPQPRLTPLPQRPGCLVWFEGDPCDQAIQQYNQFVQAREWDASVALPLRKEIAEQQMQIADQQNEIKTLQVKLDTQTTAALQSEARNRAGLDFLGTLLGVGLAFFAAVAFFRRLARGSSEPAEEKQRAMAASNFS